MNDFGLRLRKLRKQKHLTQKQLASLIGVQHTMISFYELGDRSPSSDVIVRLAQTFHVSTDYLLGVSKEAAVSLTDLSPEDQELVLQLVDRLRTKQ